MTTISKALGLLKHAGPRWVLWRTGYEMRKRSGLLKRRFPAVPWEQVRLSGRVRRDVPTDPTAYRSFREQQGGRFLIDPGRLPDRASLQTLVGDAGVTRTIAVADDFRRGRFQYYSHQVHELGWPVGWLRNPTAPAPHRADRHWCDYPSFSSELGDVKDVWEPSRFACAHWLVRAYALTGDEKYPAAFWELFESWRMQNPPNMGPNWKCGQEAAIRCFAWCFALHAFWNSPATTDARVAEMAAALALHAERIAGNIKFAVSQNNNHSLSEATGLLTIAMLFPEFEAAADWEAIGRRILEHEIPRQIYEDGSYVQHSMNYHRLMLQDCLWAIRIAERNGRPLSNHVLDRVRRALRFLAAMTDESGGGVPNYGANDGALILPLSSCDYRDFRPTVQAASMVLDGRPILGAGPWDEMSLWLCQDMQRSAPSATVNVAIQPRGCGSGVDREAANGASRFDAGGYYTLRGGNTWAMIRCHTYRDRPAHVDMLHLDLWHRGVNILGDSGTYKYFAPGEPEFERYFKDIAAHNTVEIDGRGPLELVSRFMWRPWPAARCIECDAGVWRGEHEAYNRPPWNVIHRREVRIADAGTWIVTDELAGAGQHDVVVRWHLYDAPYTVIRHENRLTLEAPGGPVQIAWQLPAGLKADTHRGLWENGRTAGWQSLYYGERTPRPVLELSGRCGLPARIVTTLSLP